MLAGRTSETKYLLSALEKEGSQLLVVYGQEGIGKTSLLLDFARGKEYAYFQARSGSFAHQMRDWAEELTEDMGTGIPVEPTLEGVFTAATSVHCRKQILILDEFQHLVHGNEEFFPELIRLIHNAWNTQPVLVILCSSEVAWIENGMVPKIGEAAYEISGFLKVRELSFADLVKRFPSYEIRDCIGVYAVLGCIPGLWRYFNGNLSLKDNICRTILRKGTILHERAPLEISERLREPAVYSTILSVIAAGSNKLNDIYNATGYNRAKISVYLKNLMELEIVEKDASVDTEGRDNAQKGIYLIRNHLIQFYFRFVYPHLSRLEVMSESDFYDRYIEPCLASYTAPFFADVCRQYMEMMGKVGQLPIETDGFGHWLGKVGTIDILGQAENGLTIAGVCRYDDQEMSYEDFEWLKFCLKQAKLKATYFYLFSAGGFGKRLTAEAEENHSIHLVGMDDL